MAEAANEWKRSNEASDALVARLPASQWTEVRYEELCADPAATLRHLATFLDLDPDKTLLDFLMVRKQYYGWPNMLLTAASRTVLHNVY